MLNPRLPAIWYGADYNPEQWPEAVWAEDVRLIQRAAMNCATIGVFSWVLLQPGPDRWDFGWFDRVIEGLAGGGLSVILATPTAAPPAWLCRAHPEILPVDAGGRRLWWGSRRHYCPNSPAYREAAREIACRLAERYGAHPSVVLWHIDNEYGKVCYCDQCATAFRSWLQDRYGSLPALNDAWRTAFWSQAYDDWEEILPPRATPSFHNPGQVLDFRRFVSDSYLGCFLEQKAVIRDHSPQVPVTTNFMGWFKGADYWSWAPHLDVISWDSYPPPGAPPYLPAAWHDLMRSLKRQPFLLMEQSPSQVNWMPCNRPHPPGALRLQSMQTLARGADGICYFQFRQSSGGPEQFHAGIVPHAGAERSRVFAEVAELGAQLHSLGSRTTGAEIRARVAIVFDWASWWAMEQPPMITAELSYREEILRYYRAFWSLNVAVDFVRPTDPLDRYAMVVAPVLRIVTEEIAGNFERFVRGGGALLLTFGSGLTDGNDRAHLGGYPGLLRELFGIWIEELDPLCDDAAEQAGGTVGECTCRRWCDAIHLEGATALATYRSGFCAGLPAITEHRCGEGKALYIGTAPDDAALAALLAGYAAPLDITAPLQVPSGVEAVQRWSGGQPLTWVLNHTRDEATIRLPEPVRDLLTGRDLAGDVQLASQDALLLGSLED
ncbi:MAG TPA: beta-galactosidase [Chloroflexota bacterium]|nr:beta-galactosidase [Chloroflexota bacterium]